jgi:hypothetical protein
VVTKVPPDMSWKEEWCAKLMRWTRTWPEWTSMG